ncbi:MAG: energy-coupling factor transporter ATPase [Oscillospiraceae bacterium]|nr:energy-coupling factor transporter ATPase [Oscillospiraceae bacterium]
MSLLKTENLTFIYSVGTPFEHTALKNINVELDRGELVGVIGGTGSGKSTLMQQFNGLLKPTEGKVYVDGVDIWGPGVNIRDIRFKVGLVFQYPEYQLFEETVAKDIAYGPKNMGIEGEELTNRVKEAANFVGIKEDMLEKSPFELSGGEKRRVAIAGSLAMRPEILILDEPTAGLDPKGREDILRRIKEYQKETGGLVVIVSHSMEDVAKYCTKALAMSEAQIYMYDDVEKVFEKTDDLVEMGLAIPQISQVMKELHGRGIDVNTNIYTVEKAKQEIIRLLGGKRA